MRLLKNMGVFALLIILTCGVIFIPPFISGQREDSILNETVFRNYHSGNRPKITSEQLARLYYEREINIGYSLLNKNDEIGDVTRESIDNIIESLFSNDENMLFALKEILNDSDISYAQSNSLIKVNNQPIALVFSNYSIQNKQEYFEVLYEEKSKTIISFSCNVPEKRFTDLDDIFPYIEKTINNMTDYYEKMNLSPDQYYASIETTYISENEDNTYSVNLHIYFGLQQYDDKIGYEENVIYN